jgi:hypothetical protein
MVNCQHLLFKETWQHSIFGCNLCKIHGEKHHIAVVKVVEGSEIYNFSIHHFVHFYSTFWSFKRSNRDTVTQLRPADVAPRRRTRRARRASGRSSPRCLGPTGAPFRGTRVLSPGRTRPEPPRDLHPRHVSYHRLRATPWTAGPPAVRPAAHIPRCRLRSTGHWLARARRL